MILIAHEIGHNYDATHGNAGSHVFSCGWFCTYTAYTIVYQFHMPNMLDDFSDANTVLIQNERPKVNI